MVCNLFVTFASSEMTKEFFYTMKQSDLCKRLREAGCFIYRHGARHDIWESPITGLRWPVPRHGAKEIPTGTLKSIEEKVARDLSPGNLFGPGTGLLF